MVNFSIYSFFDAIATHINNFKYYHQNLFEYLLEILTANKINFFIKIRVLLLFGN